MKLTACCSRGIRESWQPRAVPSSTSSRGSISSRTGTGLAAEPDRIRRKGARAKMSQYDADDGFSTRAIHAGQDADPATGATVVPIYATSTFTQESPGQHRGYDYSRSG